MNIDDINRKMKIDRFKKFIKLWAIASILGFLAAWGAMSLALWILYR